MTSTQIENLLLRISSMDRPAVMCALRKLQCTFNLDFTDEYLESLSIERLQHLLLGASMHDRQSNSAAG